MVSPLAEGEGAVDGPAGAGPVTEVPGADGRVYSIEEFKRTAFGLSWVQLIRKRKSLLMKNKYYKFMMLVLAQCGPRYTEEDFDGFYSGDMRREMEDSRAHQRNLERDVTQSRLRAAEGLMASMENRDALRLGTTRDPRTGGQRPVVTVAQPAGTSGASNSLNADMRGVRTGSMASMELGAMIENTVHAQTHALEFPIPVIRTQQSSGPEAYFAPAGASTADWALLNLPGVDGQGGTEIRFSPMFLNAIESALYEIGSKCDLADTITLSHMVGETPTCTNPNTGATVRSSHALMLYVRIVRFHLLEADDRSSRYTREYEFTKLQNDHRSDIIDLQTMFKVTPMSMRSNLCDLRNPATLQRNLLRMMGRESSADSSRGGGGYDRRYAGSPFVVVLPRSDRGPPHGTGYRSFGPLV